MARQTTIAVTLHPVRIADAETRQAVDALRQEIQHAFHLLIDQVDQLKGVRGTPELFADVQLRGHRIRDMGLPQADDEGQTRGGALSKTADGRFYDAEGLQIINVSAANGRGKAVPFEQLEALLQGIFDNPTFSGTTTVSTLVITVSLQHTGTLGVFGATPTTQPAAIAALTDNTGATANDTVENVPAAAGDAGGVAMVSAAANVATVVSVNTALTAVENDIADLTAKVNAVTAALRTLGLIAT